MSKRPAINNQTTPQNTVQRKDDLLHQSTPAG